MQFFNRVFYDQWPYRRSKNYQKTKKLCFLQIRHVPKCQECTFLETKSPCGAAPHIEEGLRIHPNAINSFMQKSGKVGCPKNPECDGNLFIKTNLFTENLNGPHGPYEQLSWDISPNKWPRNWFFDENSFSCKTTMSPCPFFGEMPLLVRVGSTAKQRF